MSLFTDVVDDVFYQHFNHLFSKENVGKCRRGRAPKTIRKGLFIRVLYREFAELEEDVGMHVGFLRGRAFAKCSVIRGKDKN